MIGKDISKILGVGNVTSAVSKAIERLEKANPRDLQEGLNTVVNKNFTPAKLLEDMDDRTPLRDEIERTVGEMTEKTVGMVSAVLGVPSTKPAVIDVIKDLAIVNAAGADDAIEKENLIKPTPMDLIEKRVIVDQYPKPGTPMDPPYLMVVAVEHLDTKQAADVRTGIATRLEKFGQFRVPTAMVAKIRQ